MAEADSESRGDSLAALASAFGDQIAVLQQTAGLRSADLSPHSRDLMELEASVQALDDSLQQIQAAMARERAAFPQVTAVTADFALPQQAAAATMALSTPNVMARPSTDHNALHSSQAKALAEALAQQASHLTFISENLPAFLPAAPQSKATADSDRAVSGAAFAEPDKENAQPRGAARPSAQPGNAAAAPAAKKAKLTAPRRFINIESS